MNLLNVYDNNLMFRPYDRPRFRRHQGYRALAMWVSDLGVLHYVLVDDHGEPTLVAADKLTFSGPACRVVSD